jgi:AraC-like DNA-binding protein
MVERLFLRLDDDAVHAPEANTPPGTLSAWSVTESLRAHVAQILVYREVVPEGHEVLERVLPDGAVRLIFNLGDAPTVGEAPRPRFEVIGASAEPVVVRLRARVEGISLALRPGAAAALLGMPAGELAGQAVPIDSLWPGSADELLDRLQSAGHDRARVAAIEGLLLRQLRAVPGTQSPAAVRAVQLIVAGGGQRSLRELAAEVGVGERRLQQLFHAHVGLSPRTFGRLTRLHGCLRALRAQPSPAWAELAQAAGFYDQSHLVNEFRALCGLTPTEFLGRRVSPSSKTLG